MDCSISVVLFAREAMVGAQTYEALEQFLVEKKAKRIKKRA